MTQRRYLLRGEFSCMQLYASQRLRFFVAYAFVFVHDTRVLCGTDGDAEQWAMLALDGNEILRWGNARLQACGAAGSEAAVRQPCECDGAV